MRKKITLSLIIALIICVPVLAGSIVYSLVPASYPILVNGTQIPSTSPNMNYNGKTYLELRTVLNMMGAATEWKDNKVNITTPQTVPQVDTSKLANSVVQIYSIRDGQDISQGSGVIIDYDKILTCYHLVDEGANNFRIIYNDGTVNYAKLDVTKPAIDTAILRPTLKVYKPVKLGDSDEVNINDKVIEIGSPNGSKNIVTYGKVLYKDTHDNIDEIATDIKSGHGASGGALFNDKGELIGINYQISNDLNEGYSIQLNFLRKALAN